jgi:hypothetical protein
MNITDELERLARLHKDGTLTDQEFAQAKAKLLSNETAEQTASQPRPWQSADRSLGEAANRYVSFQVIMSVIGFIVFAIIFFTVFLPHMTNHDNHATINFSPR